MKNRYIIIVISILFTLSICDTYSVKYIKTGVLENRTIVYENVNYFKTVSFIDNQMKIVFSKPNNEGLIFIACDDFLSASNEVNGNEYKNCQSFTEGEAPDQGSPPINKISNGGLISDKNEIATSWDSSLSFGFLSEKVPVSFFEYSRLLNIDEHSEFYLAFGSMLFASGIGSGYKYYAKNKSVTSIFISLGSHLSYLGTSEDGMTISGVSISLGYSIIYKGKLYPKITYREKFGGELKEREYKKSALNIGISFMYMGDNSIGAYPFINLERKF